MDDNTYWRATFTARATAERPKVTQVYVIAIPRKNTVAIDALVSPEIAPIFHRHSGQLVSKPLGGFVRVTHPERLPDLVSAGGYPVWIEKWRGNR